LVCYLAGLVSLAKLAFLPHKGVVIAVTSSPFIYHLTYIIMNTDTHLFVITILLFVITTFLFVITTFLLNNYLIDKKSNILSMTISIIAVMAILIICVAIFNLSSI
jgi:hypothetical protein